METELSKLGKMNEELDRAIEENNQYKTKTYIFDWENTKELICICYTTSVPKVNEAITIYDNMEKFNTYILSKRVLGVNSNNGSAVWNLYVRKIN